MNYKNCPNCNQSNEADMRFCSECGAEFTFNSADELPPTVLGGNFDLPPTVFGGNFDISPPDAQNSQPFNGQPTNFQQPGFPTQPNYSQAQPQFAPQTSLRVDFDGAWMVFDMKVEVYFDNQYVGTGSVKNGFSFTIPVGRGGTHVLDLKIAIRSQSYEFDIPEGGNFQAQISYNRATGNFSSNLEFSRF